MKEDDRLKELEFVLTAGPPARYVNGWDKYTCDRCDGHALEMIDLDLEVVSGVSSCIICNDCGQRYIIVNQVSVRTGLRRVSL